MIFIESFMKKNLLSMKKVFYRIQGLIYLYDNGLCSICSLKKEYKVDWDKRYKLLKNFTKKIKKFSKTNYDCIVPVSGGKDSYWQVLTALKLGLKPLAVTWKPAGRNSLGTENLNNLIDLGIDHIDYVISPKIEASMMLKALKRFGSIGIPCTSILILHTKLHILLIFR